MERFESDDIDTGFRDEMYKAGCADAAWDEAMTVIAEATGAEPEYVRAFLESDWGRRFGVTVREYLRSRFLQSAVRAAAAKWNRRQLPASTCRELDIPERLPCLTGLVYHVAIDAGLV